MTVLLLAFGSVAIAIALTILACRRRGGDREAETPVLLRRHDEAMTHFRKHAGLFQGTEFEVLDDVEYAAMLRRKTALRNQLVHGEFVTGQLITPTMLARVRHDLALIDRFRAAERDYEASGTARRRASRMLSVMEVVLPKRLRNEELGDAIEYINKPGRSRMAIHAKAASTIFWLLVNAARELMSVAWGRATK